MYQNIIQSYNIPKARGSQWIFTLCGDGVREDRGLLKTLPMSFRHLASAQTFHMQKPYIGVHCL